MNSHYYNEHNAYRAAVLRERMDEGFLPKGIVDERDIEIVPDEDFLGYTQIHLFAGIGGFPLGLRRAGFPEDRRIVTGGFPCEDISNAGKRAGITGARSRLWLEMVRCVRVVRPELVFVENVAALLGRGMGVVLGDLAEISYDALGDCVSAADVGAPHLRRRIWIVAYDARARSGRLPVFEGQPFEADPHTDRNGATVADATQRGQPVRRESSGCGGLPECGGEDVADADRTRQEYVAKSDARETSIARRNAAGSGGDEVCDTAEERSPLTLQLGESESIGDAANAGRWPVEPDVGRVAHGIPRRVDRLAALGDAIVPACVEEVIKRANVSRQGQLGANGYFSPDRTN
jgi:DNA (cytosine-5)-methyltransferase 1